MHTCVLALDLLIHRDLFLFSHFGSSKYRKIVIVLATSTEETTVISQIYQLGYILLVLLNADNTSHRNSNFEMDEWCYKLRQKVLLVATRWYS